MRQGSLRTSSRWKAAAVVLGVAACVGCGNGLASLSGEVTLDGAPLAGGGETRAMIYFYPDGGTGAPAVGVIDENGEFTAATGTQEGVAPGTYFVTVSAKQYTGEQIAGIPRSARSITPRKYSDPNASGLKVEVASGSNECEFALESEPTGRQRRRSS